VRGGDPGAPLPSRVPQVWVYTGLHGPLMAPVCHFCGYRGKREGVEETVCRTRDDMKHCVHWCQEDEEEEEEEE